MRGAAAVVERRINQAKRSDDVIMTTEVSEVKTIKESLNWIKLV